MPSESAPILIVDDEAVNIRVLEAILRHGRYRPLSTEDPTQAATLVQQHHPRLVILDYNMPGMDGLAVLARIREVSTVPVIMLTGMDSAEIAVKSIRSGAYDYLTKPVDSKKLLDIISLALLTQVEIPDKVRIAHYEIEREIGRGGMGVVYEAVDRSLDRHAALKVLLPELAADPHYELRFIEEARAAAKLSHPCLVTVYESGRYRGQLYFAMELVQGRPLSEHMTSGYRFSPAQSIHIALKAAEGLEAAHQGGLVHRDVKPPNLMIAPNFGVKVLDFGLARSARPGREQVTQTGAIVGTPAYASPEIIRGEVPDLRTDIYSLGVVLHELLAHDRAFDGLNQFALMMNIHEGKTRSSLRAVEGVPAEAGALVERMMALRREDRPPSMTEVIKTLRQIQKRG